MRRIKMKKKKTVKIRNIVTGIPVFIILVILALVVLIPIIWMTFSAFKTEKEIISWPPTFIPRTFTLQNFSDVQDRINILQYIKNSIIYAGGTTFLAVIVNSMAGYAYAFYEFKGKTGLFLMTLATMMVPFQVIMVPLFLVVFKMGMYDTYWGLIIPRVAVAGSIFMMRAAFAGIPKELAEAARIDGLSEIGIFWRIMIPQVKPAIITLTILSINGSWNDMLWPMIVTSSTKMRTLANGLALFVGQNTIEYGAAFAGALISLIPMFALYMIGQKYFVEGMAGTGLKG
jgi:multiple sugar transport system permease protein